MNCVRYGTCLRRYVSDTNMDVINKQLCDLNTNSDLCWGSSGAVAGLWLGFTFCLGAAVCGLPVFCFNLLLVFCSTMSNTSSSSSSPSEMVVADAVCCMQRQHSIVMLPAKPLSACCCCLVAHPVHWQITLSRSTRNNGRTTSA